MAFTTKTTPLTPTPLQSLIGYTTPPPPVFERAKTVHALDRAATVIGTATSTSVTKI
jgi:hypothetical protein